MAALFLGFLGVVIGFCAVMAVGMMVAPETFVRIQRVLLSWI
jgi:hypothetical protein